MKISFDKIDNSRQVEIVPKMNLPRRNSSFLEFDDYSHSLELKFQISLALRKVFWPLYSVVAVPFVFLKSDDTALSFQGFKIDIFLIPVKVFCPIHSVVAADVQDHPPISHISNI